MCIEVNNSFKVIHNIHPFNNGMFYKNCFMTDLLSILASYNITQIPVLLNEINRYKYNKQNKSLYVETLVEVNNNLLNQIGLQEDTKKISKDIINDLIKAIDNNKEVIIYIDCFYQPLRMQTYHKRHLPHTILLYGYNKEESNFNIIEDVNQGETCYIERKMNYKDVVNCYYGYIDNFFVDGHREITYYEYSLKREYTDIDNNKYVRNYIESYLENQKQINESIINIQEYISYFTNIAHNESELSKNVDKICWTDIYWIIVSRKAEIYKMNTVFKIDSQLTDTLNKILNNLSLIFSILNKYIYTSNYKKESLDLCINNIINFYELEKQYHKKLITFFENLKESHI